MAIALIEQITTSLAQFSAERRLYALTVGDDGIDLGSGGLLVEAFAADDRVHAIGHRDVIAVSTNAYLPIGALIGKAAKLALTKSDGTRTQFSGIINEAAMLGSEGGFARYRVRLVPWLWQLSQTRNSRVWEEKTVIEIVDSVLLQSGVHALWRWSDEAGTFMAEALPRSYCCQYRESDLAFVERLLSGEGLAWRFEATDDGERMVIFADSTQLTAVPEDASSEADNGIRFHNVRAGERQDTVQALRSYRGITASMTSVLSYDYKSKQIVGASAPSRLSAGASLPVLEAFDVPGAYAFANLDQAQRYADLQMEGLEARAQLWQGRSTVRTLRAGTRITVLDGPLKRMGGAQEFTILRLLSVGVNNLPAPARQALAELFGPIPELLQDSAINCNFEDIALVIAQAQETGYANCFEAVEAGIPWRPEFPSSYLQGRPCTIARGLQSAIVVGADGSDQPAGADELYCDKLGRVRIRYHWQEGSAESCWVRVAQRSAGGGMGSQFLPRIGQEVLVQFLENDIDRPIIVGALYNGQGEGGVLPTPAGQCNSDDNSTVFASAHDDAPSAQGNVAGGSSPVWHGGSVGSDGHRNGGAQWGIRSKEFGASGYNQLLFDDTDEQGRIQLKSSHASSELNMGHLIHSADNYRGSFRGIGAEMRTDAYGAVRAGAGLLISSYKIKHSADSRDPAGDNSAGIAMIKQAVTVSETFSQSAATHQTVQFSSYVGAAKTQSSMLDEKSAPMRAMLTAVSGMLASEDLAAALTDGSSKATAPEDGKVPHSTDAVIAIAAKAGLGVMAGQSVQLCNGEAVTLMSGGDTQFVTGEQVRVHSGQAIGLLGGAVKPGECNVGVQLIAANGAIELQAQSAALSVQAKGAVEMLSTNAHVDFAAAKCISLSTAGGANITIENGNITIQCPGKLRIHAGRKSFLPPARSEYLLPVLPRAENSWVDIDSYFEDWETPWPLAGLKFAVAGKTIIKSASVAGTE